MMLAPRELVPHYFQPRPSIVLLYSWLDLASTTRIWVHILPLHFAVIFQDQPKVLQTTQSGT